MQKQTRSCWIAWRHYPNGSKGHELIEEYDDLRL